MKKGIIFGLIFLFGILVCYGQNITHKVVRGETFKSIAAMYNVSEEKLKEVNSYASSCYTGVLLNIPNEKINCEFKMEYDDEGYPLYVPKNAAEGYIYKGLFLVGQKKFSSAKKEFNKALKMEYNVMAQLYRGICEYNLCEWKSAIKDLEGSLASDKLGGVIREDVKNMLATAKNKIEEIREENKINWGGIMVSLAQTAVVTAAQIQQSQNMATMNNNQMSFSNNGNTNYGSMSNSEFQQKINNDLNALMWKTIREVEQQEYMEYINFCTYHKKADGTDYSMQEWRALKGATIQALKEEGYDIIAENNEMLKQQREDFRADIKADKERRFRSYGYNVTSSSSTNMASQNVGTKNVLSSSNKTLNSKSTPYGHINNEEASVSVVSNKQDLDAKQQFKNNRVNKEDYQYVKKVNLYRRDGADCKLAYSNKELYKRGANYYILLNNSYYPLLTGGVGGFNYNIVYGATHYYLDK